MLGSDFQVSWVRILFHVPLHPASSVSHCAAPWGGNSCLFQPPGYHLHSSSLLCVTPEFEMYFVIEMSQSLFFFKEKWWEGFVTQAEAPGWLERC